MTACTRCPYTGGCWPECRYPSASWSTGGTSAAESEPPRWVIHHDGLMDELAAFRREVDEICNMLAAKREAS